MDRRFDPSNAACWTDHGRTPEHARVLAETWTRLPDLPHDAPLELRSARLRERAAALRPVMEAMTRAAEAERHRRNFSFTEAQIASGKGGLRETFIIAARDQHGYDWDNAIRYAEGRYSAEAGWQPRERALGVEPDASYDHGFSESGGDRADLFDTARRAFRVAEANQSRPSAVTARPLPSAWLMPSDGARPARWERRLLILGGPEAGAVFDQRAALLLPQLDKVEGADAMLVLAIVGGSFIRLRGAAEDAGRYPGNTLAALLAGREFEDILVAAIVPEDLAVIDRHAGHLPLCRTMERTRNSVIQQRQHLRIWLARGFKAGETLAGGHIRWGKAIQGLTARLGEFTARYMGKDPARGHRIRVETDGVPATGFFTAGGAALPPEQYISNRAHLRRAMTDALRTFGASLSLGSPGTSHAPGRFVSHDPIDRNPDLARADGGAARR